jgi:hypothetical protein
MPLVRSSSAPEATSPPRPVDRDAILAALASNDSEAIRAAAVACGDQADGIALLVRRLAITDDKHLTEILIFAIAAIGGRAAAVALAPLLRDANAQRRFQAIEAVRQLGPDAITALDLLVGDPDPQVRILAAEFARGPCGRQAAGILAGQLAREDDVNVCGAFVDVLAEIGSTQEAPVIRALAQRFPDSAFLRFSVDAALTQIEARRGADDAG